MVLVIDTIYACVESSDNPSYSYTDTVGEVKEPFVQSPRKGLSTSL